MRECINDSQHEGGFESGDGNVQRVGWRLQELSTGKSPLRDTVCCRHWLVWFRTDTFTLWRLSLYMHVEWKFAWDEKDWNNLSYPLHYFAGLTWLRQCILRVDCKWSRDLQIVFYRLNRIGRPIRFRIESSNRIGRIYHASRKTAWRTAGVSYRPIICWRLALWTNEGDVRNWVLVYFNSVLIRVKQCRCTLI